MKALVFIDDVWHPGAIPREGLAGLGETFTETDEHYFMHFDDPSADVFLHSISEYGTQPAGWTRRIDKGRVCMLTPGHNLSVWLNPSFQQLLRNGLAWVSNADPS